MQVLPGTDSATVNVPSGSADAGSDVSVGEIGMARMRSLCVTDVRGEGVGQCPFNILSWNANVLTENKVELILNRVWMCDQFFFACRNRA